MWSDRRAGLPLAGWCGAAGRSVGGCWVAAGGQTGSVGWACYGGAFREESGGLGEGRLRELRGRVVLGVGVGFVGGPGWVVA